MHAQPAGGRSSFAFDDYAGQVDDYLGKPVPRQQHSQKAHFSQPPGGRTSHVFSDGSMQAGDASMDRSLLKAEQPPGGRSSFSFNNHELAARTEASRSGLQPPGGRSSLSLHDGAHHACAQPTSSHALA